MANTTAMSPGTVVDDATIGTLVWSNPDNAKTENGVYAGGTWSSGYTHYLKATNFGFSIPAGAIIDGINVEIKRKNSDANWSWDNEVKIVKSDGTIGTTNKASATTWSNTLAYFSYGGVSDLWDETWDATKINDTDFGVVLSVWSKYPNNYIIVDHIRITIYYTEPPTTTGVSTMTGVQSITF